ncbi:UNVERIFIED_CONTAM: hypothetical protein FKN15_034078 [Acipenser sinensis]
MAHCHVISVAQCAHCFVARMLFYGNIRNFIPAKTVTMADAAGRVFIPGSSIQSLVDGVSSLTRLVQSLVEPRTSGVQQPAVQHAIASPLLQVQLSDDSQRPSSESPLPRVFMIDHSVEDWHIALTARRVFSISLELVVCALHPVPLAWLPGSGEEGGTWMGRGLGGRAGTPRSPCSHLLPAGLGAAAQLHDVPAAVPGALLPAALQQDPPECLLQEHRLPQQHQIPLLLRAQELMNTQPGLALLAFIVFLWLTAFWILTLCERQSEGAVGSMEDTVWLVAITFLTIGYGDLTPKTTCGMTVCLLTGVMGVGCTAMLVAVISNKLVLNKAEKHVHQFMMDTKDTKKIRNAAANVLRECWLLHRSSRGRRHGGEHRRDQRRLLKAIQVFRNARLKQSKKTDHGNKVVDLLKHLQRITCDHNVNWSNSYKELEQRINSLEQKMDALRIAFHDISQPLSRAVQHRAEDYSLT